MPFQELERNPPGLHVGHTKSDHNKYGRDKAAGDGHNTKVVIMKMTFVQQILNQVNPSLKNKKGHGKKEVKLAI